MFQAVLSNPSHPEYGVATIPFPIPRDQYAHCMELLEALEIGDAVKADCKVEKIDSFYTVLKRTEMLTVNVEELNCLSCFPANFQIFVMDCLVGLAICHGVLYAGNDFHSGRCFLHIGVYGSGFFIHALQGGVQIF